MPSDSAGSSVAADMKVAPLRFAGDGGDTMTTRGVIPAGASHKTAGKHETSAPPRATGPVTP
ncbi:hypothetical protein [Actinoplanes sp. NPDC049316]|uniref:hypothetical protein n=1 Tax=Actinoplanes sp. NPDC049316 TaxID=3154727 RepID=UPI0034343F33